ncbi:MAG: hypothetical protein J5509_11055 [Lachnospiraceae bacterium]|nr:hypothetical protein [Lachnospiraceae bacterium]
MAGSNLTESEKPGLGGALSGVKDALKGAAKSVGKSMAQTMGVVEKAVIEIADFSDKEVDEQEAQKPGGGGSGGFSAGLASQFAKVNKIATAAANALQNATNALTGKDGGGFEINKSVKKTTFEVQFNPNELNFTGYGGEQMAIQNYSGEGKNKINNVDSHIEMTIPLIFDKVDNQDAFYSDKFTLGQTSVVRGAAKLGKGIYDNVKGNESSKTVQPEIEAFTAIIRSNDKRLIRFVWGDMAYEGILNGVNAEYTMFNVNGEPVRATMTLRVVLLDADKYDQTIRIWTKKYKEHMGFSKENTTVASTGILNTD